MTEFLRASWGFDLMIGGFFVVLLILMVLDGPGQRRDLTAREDGQERSNEKHP